jgi:hypothetical protein
MANRERGEVELKAGDKTYVLRFGMNAVVEVETLMDMGIREIAAKLQNPDDFRIGTWRAVLWGALHEHQPSLTLLDAGDILGAAGVQPVVEALSQAMMLTFPEAKADGENPQTASPQAGQI